MKRLFLILLLLMFASMANAYTLTNPTADSLYAWDDSANAPMWVPCPADSQSFLAAADYASMWALIVPDTIDVGKDDATTGVVNIFGGSSSGELHLYNSQFNDDEVNAWFFYPEGTTFWIGTSSAISQFKFTTTGNFSTMTYGTSFVTDAELGYLDGVTSAVQTQLDNKQPLDAALTALAETTSPSAKAVYYYNGSIYEWVASLMFDVILQAGINTAGSIGRSTDKITLRNNANSATLNFSDDSAIAAIAVIDASGFNGNLTTTDDTIQEISQKLDDLVTGGGTNTDTGSVTLDGGTAVSSSNDDVIDGGSAS